MEEQMELSKNEEVEERQIMCPKGPAGKMCRKQGVELKKRQSPCVLKRKKLCRIKMGVELKKRSDD